MSTNAGAEGSQLAVEIASATGPPGQPSAPARSPQPAANSPSAFSTPTARSSQPITCRGCRPRIMAPVAAMAQEKTPSSSVS